MIAVVLLLLVLRAKLQGSEVPPPLMVAVVAAFCTRIPGDFDVSLITWRPDYDRFFYRQLSRHARRIYLFRTEYILDLEKVVAVETPQLGHATYLFSKPMSMEGFLEIYTKVTKDDIRQNRRNGAEKLGFLGRVIHGANPRVWLKKLRRRSGE